MLTSVITKCGCAKCLIGNWQSYEDLLEVTLEQYVPQGPACVSLHIVFWSFAFIRGQLQLWMRQKVISDDSQSANSLPLLAWLLTWWKNE